MISSFLRSHHMNIPNPSVSPVRRKAGKMTQFWKQETTTRSPLIKLITLQGTNISRLGKRKIIFKNHVWWDTLIPRRVVYLVYKSLLQLPSVSCITNQFFLSPHRISKIESKFKGNIVEELVCGNPLVASWPTRGSSHWVWGSDSPDFCWINWAVVFLVVWGVYTGRTCLRHAYALGFYQGFGLRGV